LSNSQCMRSDLESLSSGLVCAFRKDNEQLKSELALEMRSATKPTSQYEQALLVSNGPCRGDKVAVDFVNPTDIYLVLCRTSCKTSWTSMPRITRERSRTMVSRLCARLDVAGIWFPS
jgi:hypothetical protein